MATNVGTSVNRNIDSVDIVNYFAITAERVPDVAIVILQKCEILQCM